MGNQYTGMKGVTGYIVKSGCEKACKLDPVHRTAPSGSLGSWWANAFQDVASDKWDKEPCSTDLARDARWIWHPWIWQSLVLSVVHGVLCQSASTLLMWLVSYVFWQSFEVAQSTQSLQIVISDPSMLLVSSSPAVDLTPLTYFIWYHLHTLWTSGSCPPLQKKENKGSWYMHSELCVVLAQAH